MKGIIYTIILATIFSLLMSCGTRTIYVPVESEKKEAKYKDRWHRDSIHVIDSIIINKAGDTIYIEKYKYVYKDKLIRDSIYITDSVRVEIPYPVVEVKEVNRLKNWQIILMCLGSGFVGYIGFRIFRFIKRFI